MHKIGAIIAKEIRDAFPPTIFFLCLFHLIALTKAIALDDYSLTAWRAAGATVGALIVAKAILVVEALPIAKCFAGRLAVQVLWKTLLYGMVALLFRVVEELMELASKQGGVVPAATAIYREVSWPLFGVLALWILGGLLLYCLASALVHAIGSDRVKDLLFSPRSSTDKCAMASPAQ
jgi:hypothetical protein